MDELVKRLRNHAIRADSGYEIGNSMYLDILKAADAIEELQKRVPKRPHGRLIDADALIDSFDPSDFWNPDAEDNCFAAIHVVNCAPTIIPEEEEET